MRNAQVECVILFDSDLMSLITSSCALSVCLNDLRGNPLLRETQTDYRINLTFSIHLRSGAA